MKSFTDTEYICSLISEGEHQQQDFKAEISDSCKIARTLSAFANTRGGRLLIGVKDNGKIAGVSSEEEYYMIEAAARMYCSPQINCRMHTHWAEGRCVLVAEIEESLLKPVWCKDSNGRKYAYLRMGDENILATPIHLLVWQQNGNSVGELTTFTERERLLLHLIGTADKLSFSKCCRLSHLPRRTIEQLLARFVRYGIVEMLFENHKFAFRLNA